MRSLLLFFALTLLLKASDTFFLSQHFHFDDKGNGWTVLHFELLYPALHDLNGSYATFKAESHKRNEGFLPLYIHLNVRDTAQNVIADKAITGLILDAQPWGVRDQMALPGRHSDLTTTIEIDVSLTPQRTVHQAPPKPLPVKRPPKAAPGKPSSRPMHRPVKESFEETNRTTASHYDMTFEKFQTYKHTEAYKRELENMDEQRKQFLQLDKKMVAENNVSSNP